MSNRKNWETSVSIAAPDFCPQRMTELSRCGINKIEYTISRTYQCEDFPEKAKEIFENLGTALAFALNNASGLLNPETVILFGDFVKYSPLFLSSTENLLKQLLGDECPEIVLSTLNNDAAAVGATLFATDKFIEKLKFID